MGYEGWLVGVGRGRRRGGKRGDGMGEGRSKKIATRKERSRSEITAGISRSCDQVSNERIVLAITK